MAKRNNWQELLQVLNKASVENTGQPLQDHVADAAKRFVNRVMEGPPPKSKKPIKEVPKEVDEVAGAFKVLGLDPTADKGQIKNAYRYLAKKYHSDNQKTGDEAKMVQVNLAWETLEKAGRT